MTAGFTTRRGDTEAGGTGRWWGKKGTRPKAGEANRAGWEKDKWKTEHAV